MTYIMRADRRRWYLKGIYDTYETARANAVRIRKKTNANYKIQRDGLFGGFELWVTRKGF